MFYHSKRKTMHPLHKIIQDEIERQGFISVARYMELALYHPQYGYYMTRDPFGAKGDFTTAPEISQMFGELIAAWIANTWIQMGSPASVQLVECGAGRGTLIHDIMRATRNIKGFHEAVRICIIECSPFLRKIQQEKLSEYHAHWFENIQQIDDVCSIIIGNEFLDALPMRQFMRHSDHWFERVVINSSENGDFEFSENKLSESIDGLPVYGIKQGAIYEISQAQNEFIGHACNKLKNSSGVMMMIDYGYIQGSGGDTLQALKNNAFSNVLENCGEVDITAHVNFKSIENEILKHGVTRYGVKEQGSFLNHLGIEARARKLCALAYQMEDKTIATKYLEDIESAKRRLTDRDQMGSLFKVIAASYGFDFKCTGF